MKIEWTKSQIREKVEFDFDTSVDWTGLNSSLDILISQHVADTVQNADTHVFFQLCVQMWNAGSGPFKNYVTRRGRGYDRVSHVVTL